MMNSTGQASMFHRTGQARLSLVAALLVLTLAGLAGLWLALFEQRDAEIRRANTPVTQQQIDDRLGSLQQQFQAAVQEKQDLGRIESLVRLFTEDHPDEPVGHVLFAQVQMQRDRWDLAYRSWLEALSLDAQVFNVHKMAGFCAAKLGQLDQAQSHYSKAIQLAGDRADNEVHASLGRLYLALGDFDRSEAAFRQSLQAPGANRKTNWKHRGYGGLADVASARGRHGEAIDLVGRALKFSKLDSSADEVGYQIQKARLLMDAGQPEDARRLLNHLAQQTPNAALRIESAKLHARLYEQAGDQEKAFNHIAMVCQLYQMLPERRDNELADLYALLAGWQIKTKRYGPAQISISNLKTLVPNHPSIADLQTTLQIDRRSHD